MDLSRHHREDLSWPPARTLTWPRTTRCSGTAAWLRQRYVRDDGHHRGRARLHATRTVRGVLDDATIPLRPRTRQPAPPAKRLRTDWEVFGNVVSPGCTLSTERQSAAQGWLGRALARWQRDRRGGPRPGHGGGVSQRTGPGTAVALPGLLRFQRPPVEPCMQFSCTRLTDVLHRRCAAGARQGRLGLGATTIPLRETSPRFTGDR